MSQSQFSKRILDVGFVAALVMAGVAFAMAGTYLLKFAESSQDAVQLVLATARGNQGISPSSLELMQNALGIHAYVARVLLVSCGMFVGLAFGFLGFALFLVGASGSSDLSGEVRGFKASASALAPGTIALLAATVLVTVCVNRPLPADLSLGQTGTRGPILVEPPEGDPLLKPENSDRPPTK